MIDNLQKLEDRAIDYGLLPFFSNTIPGFSVEEMTAPGMLFGSDNQSEGCWEWKGPVIRRETTAYGKFFRRKAGFVTRSLLPDFINYRRHAYPVVENSIEDELLRLIREYRNVSSTSLRQLIFGVPKGRRRPDEPVDTIGLEPIKIKRSCLERPLQNLQMGAHICIADFVYKRTGRGERYGWGVALYSTPEIIFGREISKCDNNPEESFGILINTVAEHFPSVARKTIENLLS